MQNTTDSPLNSIGTISVVGLGKLGSPMLAVFASKGYQVIGVDVDPRRVQLINQGIPPVFEPSLADLLHTNRGRFRATDDFQDAIAHSEVTFIVVPTPSDERGGFSVRHVLTACERVGDALHEKREFHLVIMTSTVLPGATENKVKPALEARSGKRCGVDFGLCYSPEFIALGSVIRDFLNPDFILIGESDPRSGELLAAFYKSVCENTPPVARMNFVNAELTKIALNSFVTMKITFANTMARICERLPRADVDVITAALGLDSRIGPKYLRGAIGYGGPCFPRDNVAFAYFARRVGATATLAEATDAMNRQQVLELAEVVRRNLPERGQVAILGLAYKPNTDVVEEAQGLELARLLANEGLPVTVYDPAAMENAERTLGDSVAFASSLEACVTGADAIVITTPWEEFRRIEPSWLAGNPRRPVLVDCWRILEPARYRAVADYSALGVGPESGHHDAQS
jgi:UDPglucose 6-dehydrogenase